MPVNEVNRIVSPGELPVHQRKPMRFVPHRILQFPARCGCSRNRTNYPSKLVSCVDLELKVLLSHADSTAWLVVF
jgi:hypothetical protein